MDSVASGPRLRLPRATVPKYGEHGKRNIGPVIAQALAEGIPIVSADTSLDAYGVQRLW